MTAGSMHASHREHRAGRSAPYGAFGRELHISPARSTRHLPRVRGAFYSEKIRSGTLPSASVGNGVSRFQIAGLSARLPELLSRNFFASSHEPGSQTARDSTDGHPRGPFVGSDPPWLFLSHALKHRSGNVPDQRNVFTFAEIQDGRRT